MRFYAQPYDLNASGFYFSDEEEYTRKAKSNFNSSGFIVEEYEIQFIDGDDMETLIANAFGLNQCNFTKFIDFMSKGYSERAYAAAWWLWHNNMRTVNQVYEMEEDDLESYILHECDHDCAMNEESALADYAAQYVEDSGLLSEVPENIRYYFDFTAYGRDMRLNGEVDAEEVNDIWYIFDAQAD